MLALYTISYVTLIAGDLPIHCQSKNITDVCLNNGTCFLTSKSAAYQLCREEETYFSGDCYKIVMNRKTWFEAHEICEEGGGSLATIENEFQQLFVSNYLITSLKINISEYNVTVWFAGHIMLNGSQQVHAWTRNNYMNEIDFWENGQLQMNDGSCIGTDSQSMFHDWSVINCSNYNYFICSRPVSEEMNNELNNTQCLCNNGYRGRFCDQSINNFGIAFESQSVACIDNEFEFSCPIGGSIHVDFAAYGNNGKHNKICLPSAPVKTIVTYWEECVHPSSLQTMINMCQGLTYCRIKNLQSLFSDSPCLPTTPISLQYRMRCLFEPMTICSPRAIYQNGRCYVPYATEKPLSFYKAQRQCRKEGGQLAFLVGRFARNKIALAVRKQALNVESSCYWMNGLGRYNSFCKCYHITNKSAFWSQRNCNSSQQWVCQFAPKTQSTETQHTIFNGLSNIENTKNNSTDNETNFRRKRSFCEEYEWNGVIIPRTLACSETQIPCPDYENTIGLTTQKCGCESNGWEGKPNTTNCTHKWIGLLNQLIDNETSAEEISQKWAQFLQNSTKQILFVGDLVGSIEISKKLLSLAKMQYAKLDDKVEQNKKAIEFTEMVGKAGNELLSDHAATVWMNLPDDIRISKISSLISELEKSVTFMAHFIIEKQKKIEYSNWAFEVQVKNSTPEAIQSSHADSNEKSKLVHRSHMFSAPFFSDTITSNSGDAIFDGPNGNVTFNFSLSPVLLMPPLEILRKSTLVTSVQSTPTFFAQPRSRPTLSSGTPLVLAYYVFRSVGALLNTNKTTITNSLVIGASVNDPASSIPLPENYPITFKFYHIRTNGVNNPRCVFWDTFKKNWSKDGCKILRTMNDSTECACTHLTGFAILMDIAGLYDYDDKSVVNEVLNFTTTIGCICSIICLFFASLIFICFRSLWNVRHMIHSNLCFCLLLAELIFVIGINRIENKTVCRAIAVALHYFFLAAFCWMLLEGYQLYLMLVQVFEDEEGKTIVYCLFAYGFPAVIVAVTAGVAWSNYSTDQYCWLNVETSTIWAFAGPIAVVILSNIVFLGVALRVVLSVPNRCLSRTKQMLGWLKGSATLLCLLGVTWIFGYLMVIQGAGTVFAYIFTVLNCLQGVFIFVIHIILNDKMRSMLLRCIRMNICCVSDTANAAHVISNRQKLIDMMKNSDSSRVSSQPPIVRNIKKEKEGVFVEKISPRIDGKGSPTTIITYLDWKRKVSNDSISVPSDDSGSGDCKKTENLPISSDIATIINQSQKNSDINSKEISFPIRRKISYSNSDEFKSKQKKSSEK